MITIRLATANDANDLAQLHSQSFERPYSQNDFVSFLSNDCYCWLAETDITIAGFLLIQRSGHEAEILSLAVTPQQRGKRLAQNLIEAVLNNCPDLDIKSIFLEVRANNDAALHCYHKYGFKQIAQRPNYYQLGNQFFDAIIMQKLIAH